MTRASKIAREEMRAKRKAMIDKFADAFLPSKSPEMLELRDKAIHLAGELNGANKNIDNLSEEQIPKIKEKFETVEFYMRDKLMAAAKTLKHWPGGAKEKTTLEQKLAIIEEITSLVRGGLELRQAKVRVRLKRSLSLSTVQRIWNLRQGLLNEPPKPKS
jgi:hypothetical protein